MNGESWPSGDDSRFVSERPDLTVVRIHTVATPFHPMGSVKWWGVLRWRSSLPDWNRFSLYFYFYEYVTMQLPIVQHRWRGFGAARACVRGASAVRSARAPVAHTEELRRAHAWAVEEVSLAAERHPRSGPV